MCRKRGRGCIQTELSTFLNLSNKEVRHKFIVRLSMEKFSKHFVPLTVLHLKLEREAEYRARHGG